MKDKSSAAAVALGDTTRVITQQAIMIGAGRSINHAIHTATAGAVGCLHTLAALVASKEAFKHVTPETATQEHMNALVNVETVTFAALLAARACPEAGGGDTCTVETSPSTILEAMEDFEKLTGKRPDQYLLTTMVEAVRRAGANGAAPLEDYLSRRQIAPPPPAPH